MSAPRLADADFEALRTLLARDAGLVFDQARRSSLALSVSERLRATGARTVPEYLARLGTGDERQRLLDEVTIQETHFFRNPPQVQALRRDVLPELVREAATAGRRRLRVWSAGCSTGEEPYTVAMLLRELVPDGAGWDVEVLGTDLSERALEAARTARYGSRAVQLATPADLARGFLPGPAGSHEVRPEVRALVALRRHNLVADPAPYGPGEVDLVLCRNVTIYFGRDTTRALVARFARVLRPGGYLLLGHAETLWQVSEDFRLVPLGSGDATAFVYRLPEPEAPAAAVPAPRRRPRPVPPVEEPAPDPVLAVREALAQGRYDDAAQAAAAALVRQPLRADLHYLQGLALVDAGRDDAALVALRGAAYLAPQDGLAHFLLAGVLARLGDAAAARREYAAAAAALAARPPAAGAAELGGRSAAELARLCLGLATA